MKLLQSEESSVTNNVIYETRVVQGGAGNNALLAFIIITQVCLFVVDSFFKLNLEMQKVWFPTAMLFVILLVGYMISNSK